MEEQKMESQISAPLDNSKILEEFPPMLKSANSIVKEVVQTQFRVRIFVISSFILFYLVISFGLSIHIEYLYLSMSAIIVGAVVGLSISLCYHYKKNWVYPVKKNEFQGHYIKLYYWREYFQNTQSPNFNIQTILPNVMGDMIYFVKDINSIFKERRILIYMFIPLAALIIITYYLVKSEPAVAYLQITTFILCIATVVMEIALLIKMKRSFSHLIKNLEKYNRNIEEFWKRYW
ncbi:MAG: hypothetical protein Q7J68_06050 [Thermoplasmata archaeon]|nr:hypothetical protein [Thermoplasmata archaeon]